MQEKIKQAVEGVLKCKALEVTKITDGFSHFNFEVKIDKEPGAVIVRFSNNKDEEYGLKKEEFVIKLLEKNNIPVPKIFFINDHCMILEKLKGIRLDTIWKSLSKNEKIQITIEIGKLLKNIHNIKLNSFGKITGKGVISDKSFLFKNTNENINFSPFLRECLRIFGKDFFRLLSYKHLSTEFVTNIIKVIHDNLETIDYKDKPTLIHVDFHEAHLFVKKINNAWKITGLIDFEFARSLSPEYDFIKLHRGGFFNDPELLNALKQGYGKINEKSVYIHRLMRDLGYAQVLRDSGKIQESDNILKELEGKIRILT